MEFAKAEQFLRLLGCEKIKRGDDHVKACCPLARWTHRGGKDTHPSFAVFPETGEFAREANCRCQACGQSGSLFALLWKINELGGQRRDDLFAFLRKHNQPDLEHEPAISEDDLRARLNRVSRYEDVDPEKPPRFIEKVKEEQAQVPEEVLTSYKTLPDNVSHWLHERGITDDTIRMWEVGWHAEQRRVVIPIRDATKTLVGLSGRAFGDAMPKYLHSRFKRDWVLYGEDKILPGKTGYLCEGFFHVMYLHQLGYDNAVGRMGTHLSARQAEKLVTLFTDLVIVPDGDLAGRTSADQIATMLRPRMPVRIVDMPDGKDVDALAPGTVYELLGPPQRGLAR